MIVTEGSLDRFLLALLRWLIIPNVLSVEIRLKREDSAQGEPSGIADACTSGSRLCWMFLFRGGALFFYEGRKENEWRSQRFM